VGEVDREPVRGESLDQLDPGERQASSGRLDAPVGERVAAVPRQADHPHAELDEDVERLGIGAERLAALERQQQADPLAEPVEVGAGPNARDPVALAQGTPERRRRLDRPPQGRLRDVLDADVDRADLQLDAAALEWAEPVALERPLLEPPVDELEQQVAVGVRDQDASVACRRTACQRPSRRTQTSVTR
jgi:hypothetical protein